MSALIVTSFLKFSSNVTGHNETPISKSLLSRILTVLKSWFELILPSNNSKEKNSKVPTVAIDLEEREFVINVINSAFQEIFDLAEKHNQLVSNFISALQNAEYPADEIPIIPLLPSVRAVQKQIDSSLSTPQLIKIQNQLLDKVSRLKQEVKEIGSGNFSKYFQFKEDSPLDKGAMDSMDLWPGHLLAPANRLL